MQLFFFVLIALISINHTLVERGITIPFLSSSSLHALCPYGGIATFVSLITEGTFVKKIHDSSVVILTIILVSSVLFGPAFCSYVCPLGSLQEWVSKIGKKLFKKQYNHFVPKSVDQYLRYTRYLVLIWTVYLSTKSLKLVFEAYDPYYALFNFWTGEVAITSLIVLGVVIILSLFVERPWCKYACPFGALLGLTNFIKIFKIRRNAPTCINCSKCSNHCPMNIHVSEKEKVMDQQCISCNICTSENTCPVNDTVTFSTKATPTKHISSKVVAISLIILLFGGIAIGKIAGVFITESSKVPQKIESGEFEGEYDPMDIRGSYKLSDISEHFNIPISVLAKAFMIETDNLAEFQIKELEAMNSGIETSMVKDFVAVYNGIISLEEAHDLPENAMIVLKEEYIISEEEATNALDVEPEHSEEEHAAINSSTTVTMAIEQGITIEDIERTIGVKVNDNSKTIKDICKENGVRFSEIKDELNELIK